MQDDKLLSLTNISLKKKGVDSKLGVAKCRVDQTFMFGGINDLQDDCLDKTTLPLILATTALPKNIFDKKKSKHPKPKARPPVAWPEPNEMSAMESAAHTIYDPPGKQPLVKGVSSHDVSRRVSTSLNFGSQKLLQQQQSANRDKNLVKLQLMQNADSMMNDMPLKYLYSKPELRHYAYERACKSLINLALYRAHKELRRAIRIWLVPPVVQMTEKQIGIIVLAKRLLMMLEHVMAHAFRHWVHCHVAAYNLDKLARPNEAAREIQTWWRRARIAHSLVYRRWHAAVQACLHRRRAIHHLIVFESSKRQAISKIKRGVAKRRRYNFGARSCQRVYRWNLLFRKTMWRLTRVRAARKLQRWRRMLLCRPEDDLTMLRYVIKCGGYTVVSSKMPLVHLSRGLLSGMNACASQIQKAWYTSKGNLSLYMKVAARRARLAREKLLNDNATIIQNNWRGHLWNMLNIAAYINNRARRIQRGFRAHQYRDWCWFGLVRRRHRFAKVIQRMARYYFWKELLAKRFKVRKYMIIFERAKRVLSCHYIQRAYRQHLIRVALHKEELRKFYAQLRSQKGLVIASISKIQRNWRQMKTPRQFSKHVLLLCQRIIRESRRKYYAMARTIQVLARQFLNRIHEIETVKLTKSANVVWFFAKSYLLRLSLWDHVMATKEKRRLASNTIKYNLRNILWRRIMSIKFAIGRALINYEKLRQVAAGFIQKNMRRKLVEYNMALRVAARRQLKKKRIREEAERIWNMRDQACRRIQKFFKGLVSWVKVLRKVIKQRTWLRRHRAAKKMQKFCLYVLAWSRFRTAVEEKNKRVEAERIRKIHQKASNTIGFYWRRKLEIKGLRDRFKLRKKMLDEYKKLKAQRLKAEEDRLEALEDVRRTDENMNATIAASWKQGSDTQGRNYYYNYVTGASQWTPPENWVMKQVDTWVRNMDDRQNIYYYNMQTGESRWLPPCCTCGEDSHRWCADCGVAYCDDDYEKNHGPEADESMTLHTWTAVEYTKDVLKQGEIYCIECKKRRAIRMCTTCWDAFCDECFKLIHHVGALKYHKSIAYFKAKKGWTCVKGRAAGEQDYYVNGTTSETTFEKPEELMTEQEKIYFENFKTHQAKAEEHVKAIEKLQFDLEAATYERDTILFDALNGGGNVGNLLRKRKGGAGAGGKNEIGSNTVLQDAIKSNTGGGFFSMFTGDNSAYRQKILRPTNRRRGQARSDYMKGLLEEPAK